MTKKYSLTASQEDYLEAIYLISEEKMAARAKDIADFLKVRASSVTSALRTLGSMKLVNYAPYDLVTLTKEGRQIAAEIVRRHNTLKRFLIDVLGVEESDAEEAACKMEHSIPKAIVDRLVKYSEYVDTCPKGGITWDNGFGYYCKDGCNVSTCTRNRPEGS
ncbi:MAG: DtxR family transcriptional regulator [Desulfobulbus propionicus]|nr:MAG: DtxR family transcriptional regulator [Desulfobulbus propionicus]